MFDLSPRWLAITGTFSALYTIYAGMRYYSLTGGQLITSEKAKKMLQSGDLKIVIDVRTNTEWSLGHHPNAKNIPIQQLTKKRMKGISKMTPILVYCNTGQRARSASEKLRKMGYEHVYYIADSYLTLR